MALERKKLLWISSAMTRQRVALPKLLFVARFLLGGRKPCCGRYAAARFFVVQRYQRGLFHGYRRKLFERTRPHPGGHRLVLGESLLESSELLCWNQPRTCGGGVHVIDGEITAGKSRLA